MYEYHANPMWSCWCIPDGGCRVHYPHEQACPDCGRLQPPKNVKNLIMGRSLRVTQVEGDSPSRQCMPNPETIKEKV